MNIVCKVIKNNSVTILVSLLLSRIGGEERRGLTSCCFNKTSGKNAFINYWENDGGSLLLLLRETYIKCLF